MAVRVHWHRDVLSDAERGLGSGGRVGLKQQCGPARPKACWRVRPQASMPGLAGRRVHEQPATATHRSGGGGGRLAPEPRHDAISRSASRRPSRHAPTIASRVHCAAWRAPSAGCSRSSASLCIAATFCALSTLEKAWRLSQLRANWRRRSTTLRRRTFTDCSGTAASAAYALQTPPLLCPHVHTTRVHKQASRGGEEGRTQGQGPRAARTARARGSRAPW